MIRSGVVDISNPAVRSHALNRGLVAWWSTLPGQAGGRAWFDLLGRYHGTLAGVPTWQGTTRPGGWGHLRFNGANTQSVALGDLSARFSGATEGTVAAWVKCDLAPPLTAGTTGLLGIDSGDPTQSTHYSWTDGVVYMGLLRNVRVNFTNAGFDRTRWHHLVVTSRPGASGYVVYQDSGVAHSTTGLASVYVSSASRLGGRDGTNYYFSGGMDDVRLYDRALSVDEVRALRDLSRSGYPGVLRRLPSAATFAVSPPASSVAPLASHHHRRRRAG